MTIACVARELGGNGRLLLVLHGLLGSSRNWQSAGVALAEKGYRVVALDLRNHGSSPWADDCSYPAMAADVIAFLEQQKRGPVHLLGHSMGGKVAMRVAVERPDLVSHLTVVDIAPRAYTDRVREEFAAMNALNLTKIKTRKDADQLLTSLVPDWGMRQFILTNLQQAPDGQWRWAVNREALTQSLPQILGTCLSSEEKFLGPTRFIRGGKSNYIRDEDFPLLKKHFPQSDCVTLPESGHNPHFEARRGFVEAVAT